MQLAELTAYLDGYLRTAEVPDSPGALNGLQVENAGEVTRLAVAVDASERSILEAARRGCDLLLVHHGLFWDGNRPVTGRRYRRLAPLLRHGIAVYSAHLPLDVHEEVGNNVVLARALGVEVRGRFGMHQGLEIGWWGVLDTTRAELGRRLEEVLAGPVHVMPYGPEVVRRVGIITGGGGSMIAAALEAGLDAYITGEGAHHTHFDAEEGGLNVYYGGHYATETWGLKSLAERLGELYDLPWEFIDHPTGL